MAWVSALAAVVAASIALRIVARCRFALEKPDTTAASASTEANAPVQSSFLPLGDPTRAFHARLALIEAARRQISSQYYLHEDDESGREFLSALLRATQRGVAVRLLLDDIDIGNRSAQLSRLEQRYPGLEIRVFNPLVLRRCQWFEFIARFPRVTRRMHNKSLTTDDAASILGGRNIGDEYFAEGEETWFIDHDVLIRGLLAQKVAVQFAKYWNSNLTVAIGRVDSPCSNRVFEPWHRALCKAPVASTLAYGLPPAAEEAAGRLVYDQPGKVLEPLFHVNEDGVARFIAQLLRSATDEVIFSSPYLVPGPDGLALIAELCKRGVSVVALTNSFASNDVWLVNSGYLDYRKKLLALGVQIYELKPRASRFANRALRHRRVSLHAKAFIVDRRQVFIGSLNFDARSLLHNTEMGVLFEHADCAELVHDWIENHLWSAAYRVSLEASGKLQWREHVLEGEDILHRVDPGTSRFTRCRTWMASWLPVEWLL